MTDAGRTRLEDAAAAAKQALAPSASEDDILSIRAGHLAILATAGASCVDLSVPLEASDLDTLKRHCARVDEMASVWIEGAGEYAYTRDKAEETTFMQIAALFTRFANDLQRLIGASEKASTDRDVAIEMPQAAAQTGR